MNMRRTKLTFSTGLLALSAFLLQARAQSLQPLSPFPFSSTSSSLVFGIDSNGTFSESGPINTSVSLTLTTGSQMLWIPALGAFRAGYFGGSTWTASNIGEYSIAFGYEPLASQFGSIGLGYGVSATGATSTAIGLLSTASAPSSIAIGSFSTANGSNAVAIGNNASAGNSGTAIGTYVTAGASAMAFGYENSASGPSSTALGNSTTASGTFATAAGMLTVANAYDSFVIGTYNLGQQENGTAPSLIAWQATDPLFEIGNGTGTSKSDALVVYKDGTAKFQGAVTVPASGDIPMYTGN